MLSGMRILSFCHYLQGPAATQYLTDMGAEAIKIEPPTGAFERTPFVPGMLKIDQSGLFVAANRNQRSLAVNLKTPLGREIILRLVGRYDVVIENYRPGVMNGFGLGYKDLKSVNPSIIYVSASGFGSTGPLASAPNQDLLAQAMTGMIASGGSYSVAPAAAGASITDQHAASLLALGVAGAYARRLATGQGTRVEGNLFSAAIDLQMEAITYCLNRNTTSFAEVLERDSHLANWYHPAPYGVYKLADATLALSITTPEMLCAAFDQPEMDELRRLDPFRDRDRFAAIVAGVLAQMCYDDVAPKLEAQGIWFARVSAHDELDTHPQVAANETISEIELDNGKARVINHPLRYDGAVPKPRSAPPRLGADTRAILEQAGYARDEVNRMIEDAIVVADSTGRERASAVAS